MNDKVYLVATGELSESGKELYTLHDTSVPMADNTCFYKSSNEAELSALKAENELFLKQRQQVENKLASTQANLISVYDENRALKARVAELEAQSVQTVANRICEEMPTGYEMRLHMENGAGWVELSSTNKDWIDFEGDTILDAINKALELARQRGPSNAN